MHRSICKSFCGWALLLIFALPFSVFSQPIPIGTYADLIKIGVDADYPLSGSYELTANIDASASRTAAGGFSPIGSLGSPFTGTFNGNGYRISGLYINRVGATDGRNVGLFGLTDSATVRRVDVVADSVVGNVAVGVLVGRAENSVIDSCMAFGAVRVAVGNNGGGLVGFALNTAISRSSSSGTVVAAERIGGLIGYLSGGSVEESHSSSVVARSDNSYGNTQMGGLIGYCDGSVTGSYSTGSTEGGGSQRQVGGLIGYNLGTVVRSYSTAAVSAPWSLSGTYQIGGLIGYNAGTVTDCYYEGAGVNGGVNKRVLSGGYDVGGLIGYNHGGVVTGSRVSHVSVFGDSIAGGVIGGNYGGTVENCYYEAIINPVSSGGVIYVLAYDSVNVVAGMAGGLIGRNRGAVYQSYSDGYITGLRQIGGLIGVNDSGAVTQSFSKGYVNYKRNAGELIGGLVGFNNRDCTIAQCYSLSSVTGFSAVGGLVGGLDWNASVSECYSAGEVVGVGGGDNVGGLIGSGTSSQVTRSFWDEQTSGLTTSAGGAGQITNMMKDALTYRGAGWALDSVWLAGSYMEEDADYPIFTYQRQPVSVFGGRRAVRSGVNALAPVIAIRGKVLSVAAPAGSNYGVRVIDMRGRVVTRLNVSGGGRYPLGRISAGRYLVETRLNGRVINILPYNI